MAYVHLWQFDVAPDCTREFERHYGPDGSWAQLFRQSPGYVGTSLLIDRSTPGRYVTVDRWRDAGAFDAFRRAFAAEYERLDRDCKHPTLREHSLGAFDEMGGAGSTRRR